MKGFKKQVQGRGFTGLHLLSSLLALLLMAPPNLHADDINRDHSKPHAFYITIDRADILQIRSKKYDDDFMQMHFWTTPANPYATHQILDENRVEIGTGSSSPLYVMTPDSDVYCDRAWDKHCHQNFEKALAVGWFEMNPGDRLHLDYMITNLSHEDHESAKKQFDQIAGDVDTALDWANDAAQFAGPDAQKVASIIQTVEGDVVKVVDAILSLFGDDQDTNCDGLVFQGHQDLSFDDLLNLNYTPRQTFTEGGPGSTDPDRFPIYQGDIATIEDSGSGDSAPSGCNGPGQARVTIRVAKGVDDGPPTPPPPLFGSGHPSRPTQLVPTAGAPLQAWLGQWVDFPGVGYMNQARVAVQMNVTPAPGIPPIASGLKSEPLSRPSGSVNSVTRSDRAHSFALVNDRVRAFHDLVVRPAELRAVMGGDPRLAASRRLSSQFTIADLERNHLSALGANMTERGPAPDAKVLDSYNGSGFRPLAMRAAPFSGDVYWEGRLEKMPIAVIGAVRAAAPAEPNRNAKRVSAGTEHFPAIRHDYERHFASLLNPNPFADTVILPNGASLQLYGEYSSGVLFRHRIRYLRTEPNGSITDVMLFPYTPPPR